MEQSESLRGLRRLRILGVEPYTRIQGHFGWLAARTCEALAARGHEITLLTHSGLDLRLLNQPQKMTILAAVRDLKSGRSSPSAGQRKLSPSWRVTRERLWLDLQTFRQTFSLSDREPYDVIHFFDWHPLTLLSVIFLFASQGSKERTAMTANFHYPGKLRGAQWRLGSLYAGLYRRGLARLIGRHLDTVFVFHDSLKEEIVTHLGLTEDLADRIRVIPHGMDTDRIAVSKAEARQRLGLGSEKTLLLLFGVLRKDKGIDTAIRAMKGLDSCRLLIVGAPAPDNDPSVIQETVRQLGCERTVSLEVGYVDERRIPDYFVAADVVLLPYTKSFTGQSGILSRACTYGRCVIASDVAGVGETVRGHGIGLTVEPENPDRLREAILTFLKLPPEDWDGMERQAKLLAEERSWAAVAEQLENQFSRIKTIRGG